ncbi:MAG: FAD-dependent oxidoreductase [Sphingomonadaceae bacterium]|nr:FAD-dependent oxidoreductase [Sphingomonadaceae bacterium]
MAAGLGCFDVVVVGGGLAGWIAATAALESGARTALVERSRQPEGDGNSVISGGVLHANLGDPRSPPGEMADKITRATAGEASPDVVAAWAGAAARTIEWIEAHGGDLSGGSAQMYRAKVFAPVKPIVPGLNGAPYGTAVFLRGLAECFQAAGGAIVQPARAIALARAEGGAWQLTLADGGTLDTRAVVFADGGFQANPDLVRRHIGTDRLRLRATLSSVGDALQMGLAHGAVAAQMRGFYGHMLHREAVTRDDLWPYPILDVLGTVSVIVGPDGRRFVDEGISGVRSTNGIAWSSAPDGCWLIFDDAAWNAEGRIGETPCNPYLVDKGVGPVSAPTIEALAAAIGVDAGTLAASIAALRADPAAAQPPRSGRFSVAQPPYHALPIVAGISFTFGGLKIDGDARVLDTADAPIAGLYAAGGTAAGLHGGPDVGYAGGLLEAAVFGLIAGEHAGRTAARP